MTIASTNNRVQYTGDGATVAFSFPNVFFATTDLVVTLYDTVAGAVVSPAPALNGLATYDYAVTGSQDPNTGEYLAGGTVTFNTAPLGTYRVTIARLVPQTQQVALTSNGPFPAKTVEAALDRLTLIAQQITDLQTRSLTIPTSDPISAVLQLPPAASRASMFLAFDPTGLIPVMAAGTSGGVPVSVSGAALIASTITSLGQALVNASPFLTQAKPGNYVVATTDRATILNFTGASASIFTLLAPGTAANGFLLGIRNSGTARLTLTPASGLINGVASIVVERGESFWIFVDGSNYFTIGRQLGWIPIIRQVAANVATVSFVEGIESTYYDELEFGFSGVYMQTGTNGTFGTRISIDGGATYKNGGSDYTSLRGGILSSASTFAGQSSGGTFLDLFDGLDANSAHPMSGEIRVKRVADVGTKMFQGMMAANSTANGAFTNFWPAGAYSIGTQAINGVQFSVYGGTTPGNLNGNFSLRGLRTS